MSTEDLLQSDHENSLSGTPHTVWQGQMQTCTKTRSLSNFLLRLPHRSDRSAEDEPLSTSVAAKEEIDD
ncbi:hypothetical protein YC2023_052504 [Brassica napus]